MISLFFPHLEIKQGEKNQNKNEKIVIKFHAS